MSAKHASAHAGHGADPVRFRPLALCLLVAVLAILAGCSGATRRVAVERAPVERDSGTGAPKPASPATPPAPRSSRGGGYYQDDGPGDNAPANLDQIEDAEPKVEPLHRFANNPYMVFGQPYTPFKTLAPYKQRGTGSWYGRKFHGQRTSSGEPYDMYAMTAAHPTLPIPSYARVTSVASGRSVIVRVNDRGPFHSGRLIDLSYTAAYKLGYAGAGSTTVDVVAAASVPLEPEPTRPAPPIPVDAEAGGIYLQLGAFSGRDNAENFRVRVYQQLAWLSDAIQIYSRDGMFRLHLGPYRDRNEASGMAERIRETLQFKPVIVVR
ncbi:MAG: septal ring lytic transglycosylase RlpA family protein [Proteobacteria bacterium]|nr:septal ring lytic transglycosylase RlpA family protein [Pseudomonadota bacterium]